MLVTKTGVSGSFAQFCLFGFLLNPQKTKHFKIRTNIMFNPYLFIDLSDIKKGDMGDNHMVINNINTVFTFVYFVTSPGSSFFHCSDDQYVCMWMY